MQELHQWNCVLLKIRRIENVRAQCCGSKALGLPFNAELLLDSILLVPKQGAQRLGQLLGGDVQPIFLMDDLVCQRSRHTNGLGTVHDTARKIATQRAEPIPPGIGSSAAHSFLSTSSAWFIDWSASAS